MYGFVANKTTCFIDKFGLFQLEGGLTAGAQIISPIYGAISVGVDLAVSKSMVYTFPLEIEVCMSVTLTLTAGLGGGMGASIGPMFSYSSNDSLLGSSTATGGLIAVSGTEIPVEGSVSISFDDNNPNVYLNGARGGIGAVLFLGGTKVFAGKSCYSVCDAANPLAEALATADAAKQAYEAFNDYVEKIQAVVIIQEFLNRNHANQ